MHAAYRIFKFGVKP